ncbi:MAG: hypothetical protein KW804_03515 [Candidatus Doudnabacteria bacterium]|nr:hypothetical protein [Candidatus Doudnabacteria bacterium]
MKTDYNNINKFEVAVVSLIAVGFVILGITLYSSLTPRQQSVITSSLQMFDMKEHVATTIDEIKFVYGIPNEFYNQFYIAFSDVVTLPLDDFEVIGWAVGELSNQTSVVINHLIDQTAAGYAAQNQSVSQYSQLAELSPNGKVMGAVIDVSDTISNLVVREQSVRTSLDFHYDYTPPKLELLSSELNHLNQ